MTLSLSDELSAAQAIFMASMVQRTMDAEVAALPEATRSSRAPEVPD